MGFGVSDLAVRISRTARGPVEVARLGAGPAVLVIHGIPGSWRQGVSLAEDLADHHTVLLPSRPGYGATPLTAGRTPSEQAALYAALLDDLGIERAAIIGISGGGPSSVAFAQEHPDRVSALVLACAVAVGRPMVEPPAFRPSRLRPGVAEAATVAQRALGRLLLTRPALVDRAVARSLTPAEAARLAAEPAMRDWLIGFHRSHLDAPAGLAGVRNDIGWLRPRRHAGEVLPVDRITAPTLVLHGDADTVVPVEHGEYHAGAIASAALEVYEGGGHGFLFTFRSATSPRIASFLAGVRT